GGKGPRGRPRLPRGKPANAAARARRRARRHDLLADTGPPAAGHPVADVTDAFEHLYSPLELRGRVLRNRIVSTPHATGWGRDGLIDPREVDYHVRKAAGGVGLVMTFGSASVDPTTGAS